MNVVPETAFCKAPFARICKAFRHGQNVYTEDVGSSSLSSPTSISKEFWAKYEEGGRFIEPFRPLFPTPVSSRRPE